MDRKTISHFGVHNAKSGSPVAVNANAGDTLLFQATRDLFDRLISPVDWKLEALWEEVTQDKIRELNNKRDAVLIGGGGLFLRDQKGADATHSGWQWNCPVERVQELTTPLIVFGVGYNRFRNQPDFDEVFADQITAVVEKSLFFGLRNHGSRYAIRRFLPSSLHHRVRYQPCPTTVAWHIYGETIGLPAPGARGTTMVLNAAFDRRDKRFGQKEERICEQIAGVMKKCTQEDGWELILANHKPQDKEIEHFLADAGVSFQSVDLAQMSPADIIKFYCDKDITVGMRGHAQMIPFGVRKPIVSIISHDKLGWFLDDIGHPEWGIDVEDPSFADKLYTTIVQVAEDDGVVDKIASAQERLWEVTSQNIKEIKEQL